MSLKKILLSFISVFCLLSLIGSNNVKAQNDDSLWQSCKVYSGDNLNDQNYSTYNASTIKSYLSYGENGKIMRVQALSDETILIEYYNSDYELESSKVIEENQLPLFGGFYESDDHYFIVTGQKNLDEDNNLEVVRISKYDKNWNFIKSVGLNNCNTTIPFSSGSLRIDHYGDYLLIRTSHQMYTSASDGLRHQANMTIQIRMSDMTITAKQTSVANSSYGYVSHSFNQFINIDENGHIVAVDHGDAYPRGITLTIYPTDVSTGSFTSSNCDAYNVFPFAGATGLNATKASIGGFEISDDCYLIAGNSIIQDDSYASRSTRNIYVWAVDKEQLTKTTTQVTNYDEGEGTTSTPHLIKINNNQFILMWKRNNMINYVQLDGGGNMTSEIYEQSGDLSDCLPILINNKVVWYTWDDGNINFYEINLFNLNQVSIKKIVNGHVNEYTGVKNSDEGTVEAKCIHCGLIQDLVYYQSIRVYWNNAGGNSFSSVPVSSLDMGQSCYYLFNTSYSGDTCDDEIEILIDDPTILSWTKNTDSKGYFTGLKAGNTTVTFKSKLNSDLIRSYNIIVYGPLEIASFTANKNTNMINLSVNASGGKNALTYIFYKFDSDGNKEVIYEGADSNCSYRPTMAGLTTLYVDVTDEISTVTKSLEYMVNEEDIQQLLGDVNGNGEVEYSDAVIILRADSNLITLTESQKAVGDINSDGVVNYSDAVKILRIDAGLE